MQAVVLAGGESTRFYPYSRMGHKTMVRVMGKPILEYCLMGLADAGIKDIILRVSEDGIIKKYFGKGSDFGLSITYIEQKKSLGMGDVLLNARKFLTGDFILIAGNHVNSKQLVRELVGKRREGSKGVVLVKERENPWDYGVVEVKGGKLTRIVEKPKKGEEPSKLGLVSAFLLPLSIIDVVGNIKMSEYNFEQEALAEFSKNSTLDIVATKNEIATLKYPWDLLPVKNFLLRTIEKRIDKNAQVSPDAQIIGDVVVEEGAKIMEGAKIKGPCYVGKNAKVGTNAIVRDGCCLEENSVVGAFMEIKNTLLMQGVTTHSGYIGDSIIGENCKIGASFTTANVRLDRKNVASVVKDVKIDTGMRNLGAIIGRDTKIGIKSSTMPGVIIGNNVVIGSSTNVLKNVPDNLRYYTKFQEIVEKYE